MSVVIALLFGYRQNREAARQTSEASRQVEMSLSTLRQGAYRQVASYGADFHTILFTSGPDLVEWFLSSRGIAIESPEENLRRMFMFVRMDIHESIYFTYLANLLEDDIWNGWRQAVESDVATPQFRIVWGSAKKYYSVRFGEFIDLVINKQDLTSQSS